MYSFTLKGRCGKSHFNYYASNTDLVDLGSIIYHQIHMPLLLFSGALFFGLLNLTTDDHSNDWFQFMKKLDNSNSNYSPGKFQD